jgi:hypothetical protein
MCLALHKVRNYSLQWSVSGETLRRRYYVSRSLLDVNWIAPQGAAAFVGIDLLK